MFTHRFLWLALALPALAGCNSTSEIVSALPAETDVHATAPAVPPQLLTIVQHSALNGPSTFVASGAISDAGNVTLDDGHASAIPSPVVGVAHLTRTYHGALGSLTLRLQTVLTATDVPWIWAEQGRWVIESGTGAYAGLRGTGLEEGARDFIAQTLDATFTGNVH